MQNEMAYDNMHGVGNSSVSSKRREVNYGASSFRPQFTIFATSRFNVLVLVDGLAKFPFIVNGATSLGAAKDTHRMQLDYPYARGLQSFLVFRIVRRLEVNDEEQPRLMAKSVHWARSSMGLLRPWGWRRCLRRSVHR